MDKKSDDQTAATPPLHAWERFACGVVGLAAGGAGAVAVFVSDNAIGTGVLVTVGAFFVLIGATGHPVERAKLGDNEIQFAKRLERSVAKTLEDAPSDVRTRLAEAILDAWGGAFDSLSAQARSVLYEQDVLAALHRALADRLDDISIVVSDLSDSAADALLRSRDGSIIGLHLKAWSRPVPSKVVLEAGGRPTMLRHLIVSRSGFTADARQIADDMNETDEMSRVALAVWRSPADDQDLRAALLSLLPDR